MRVTETPVHGVALLRTATAEDARGSFRDVYSLTALAAAGIDVGIARVSISRNPAPGTLRGLHFQAEPCPDAKLVTCIAGSVFDVAVDIRADSPSLGHWFGTVLDPSGPSLWIPAGCAHGFVTLQPDTAILYALSVAYVPGLSRGIRWNDPDLSIAWPVEPRVISDRDRDLPALAEVLSGIA